MDVIVVKHSIELALEDARRERAEGRPEEAERAYARAAELARSQGDPLALAHALRHLSDLARDRGELVQAREHASQAVALYRKTEDWLGLANALRLSALSAGDREEATGWWKEARDLYFSLGVSAGVTECDSYLRR